MLLFTCLAHDHILHNGTTKKKRKLSPGYNRFDPITSNKVYVFFFLVFMYSFFLFVYFYYFVLFMYSYLIRTLWKSVFPKQENDLKETKSIINSSLPCFSRRELSICQEKKNRGDGLRIMEETIFHVYYKVLRLYLIPKISTFRKKFSITEMCLGDRISIRSIMVLYF